MKLKGRRGDVGLVAAWPTRKRFDWVWKEWKKYTKEGQKLNAELQLFLEGSLLVGKVPVSPRKLCLNCLTKQGFIETIQHVEGDRNPRPENSQGGRLSP